MIIGIDFDDVTVDTFTAFLGFCNERYSEQFQVQEFVSFEYDAIWKISREQRWERFIAFDNSKTKKNIRPMPGAKEAITQLAKFHELHIITARPIEIAPGTHEMIDQHFPGIFKGVHFCSKDNGVDYHRPKPLICEEIGAVLHIEDHPVVTRECAKKGISTFLFDQPWNRSVPAHDLITRVSSWDEILKILCPS